MSMDLTVIIASRNRPQTLVRAVKSILAQDRLGFDIIVSDNSTSLEVQDALEEHGLLEKVNYRKRDKDLPSVDHFRVMLSEAKSRYLVIFHDDDTMLPAFIGRLYDEICVGDYAAVACNAYIRTDKGRRGLKIRGKSDLLFSDPRDFILEFCRNSLAPFPSYMYDLSKLSGLEFGDSVGKYSDVVWLLQVLGRGKVKWLIDPLMDYFVSPLQDSASFSYRDQQKLNHIYRGYLGPENSAPLDSLRLEFLYVAFARRNSLQRRMCTARQVAILVRRARPILAGKLILKGIKNWLEP